MSHHKTSLDGDPVIDPADENSNEEILPSTPGQEHIDLATEEQDSASILGNVFNGTFKKSYGSNALDESAALVHEPLPIETASLSPFHIGLNSRDTNSFSVNDVSVSDSLPSHVMELDSPEHDMEQNFSLENIQDEIQVLQKPENSYSNGKDSQIIDIFSNKHEENSDDIRTWTSADFDLVIPSKKDSNIVSQGDLFVTPPSPNSFTEKDSSSQPVTSASSQILLKDGLNTFSRNELEFCGEDLFQKTVSLSSPLGISPSKRKRDCIDDSKIGVDSKLLKMDNKEESNCEDESDSDIEFLTETSASVNDQSIEVLYDKNQSSQQLNYQRSSINDYDSQNLDLQLTAISECSVKNSAPINYPVHDLKLDQIRSQSPSLLSMQDSDDLVCKDTISSSEESDNPVKISIENTVSSFDKIGNHFDSTIAATQVEMICNTPATFTQPNIKPLLEYPLAVNTKKLLSTSNTISLSTNKSLIIDDMSVTVSSSTLETKMSSSQLIESVISPEYTDKPPAEINSQLINPSVTNISHFDTPSDNSITSSPEAAEQQLHYEQQSIATNTVEKQSSEHSPDIELNCSKAASVNSSIGAILNANPSFQSPPPMSSHIITSGNSSFLFSQSNNKSEDALKVTYVEDSDEEVESNAVVLKPKTILDKKKLDLKTSTPNTSSVISPNISEDGQSFIRKNTSTPNSRPVEEANSENHYSSSSLNSTEEIHNFITEQDLIDGGMIRIGIEIMQFPTVKWSDPTTGKVFNTFESCGKGEDNLILRYETRWHKINHLCTKSSEIVKDRRISDISSISRSTTTSSSYFGDKSSSDSMRLESTRLSMASVTTVGMSFGSPPRDDGDDNFFIPPKSYPHRGTKSVKNGIDKSTSTADENDKNDVPFSDVSSSSTDSDTGKITMNTNCNAIAPTVRRAGPGRPKGRSHGSRPFRKKIVYSEPLIEEQPVISSKDDECASSNSSPNSIESQSRVASSVIEDKSIDLVNNINSTGLSEEKNSVLHTSNRILSDEEEAVFLLEDSSNLENWDQQKNYIKSKIREAMIVCDMMVFARYIDDSYYPAMVIKRSENDKWVVKYVVDNCIRDVRDINIIPYNILPCGLVCWVRHPNSIYSDVGIIKSHCVDESGAFLHLIDVNKETMVKALHSHIVLKGPVANDLLERRRNYSSVSSSPHANLSLDNIMFKKRRDVSTPSPSMARKKLHSPSFHKADLNLDTSADDVSLLPNQSTKPHSVKKLLISTLSESSEYEPRQPTTPKSTPKSLKKFVEKTPKQKAVRRTPKRTKKLITYEEEDEGFNPIVELAELSEKNTSPVKATPKKRGRKPKNSTSAKKIMRIGNETSEVTDSANEDSIMFTDYKILITQPDFGKDHFDKEKLKQKFEKGGGLIVDSFDDANLFFATSSQFRKPVATPLKQWHAALQLPASKSPFQVLCISNGPCLTAKYIQCLTVGIPIVDIRWILDSIAQKSCLNWFKYLLLAGRSLLTGDIEQKYSDENSLTDLGHPTLLLEGTKIFLATSDNPQFTNLWKTILSLASASLFYKSSGGNLNRLLDRRTNVVIADPTIPKDEEKKAIEANVPIVSSIWFIESLLTGTMVQYDAHGDFLHTFVKKKKENVIDEERSSSSDM